jgi:hypothetical protein
MAYKRVLGRALGIVVVGIETGVSKLRARVLASRSDELDTRFHEAYDARRAEKAHAAPVLVLHGDSLMLLLGSKQREFTASHPRTRIIQAAAHAPVGIFATLHEQPPFQPLTAAARGRLAALRAACKHAHDALEELKGQTREDVRQALERSQEFIDTQLARERVDLTALNKFSREIGPLLLALIDHATQLELEALHAAADDALGALDSDQLRELEVVVIGAHQARARSLGMQYFQKRFGESAGEERRVVYAESADDVEEARTLVGTRRLDRVIARAFFGDPKRLQRDVLGDAAKAALDHIELKRIR